MADLNRSDFPPPADRGNPIRLERTDGIFNVFAPLKPAAGLAFELLPPPAEGQEAAHDRR